SNRLDYYRLVLESTLEKYETLPFVLAQQREIARALESPETEAAAANGYLEMIAARAKVGVIYLMDPSGTTIASSNWRLPASFVGKNYRFRPYFNDALAGGPGHFFAIGATSGEPGYFLSYPVRGKQRGGEAANAQNIDGVLAVKVVLDDLE